MAYDDLDLNYRQRQAAQDVAHQLATNTDINRMPYDLAADRNVPKLPAPNYGKLLSRVIEFDSRLTLFWDQSFNLFAPENLAQLCLERWLEPDRRTTWVHCFSRSLPELAHYRVYVCADLAKAHLLLAKLLENYEGFLYFKVASHDEARLRNDTFVSWHETLDEAKRWANIARNYQQMLSGNAPAGTFASLGVPNVGIDAEVTGQTSTNRIAQQGLDLAIRHNPFI